MRISGVAAGQFSGFVGRRARAAKAPTAEPSRALVVVEPVPVRDALRPPERRQAQAALIAHLFAMQDGLPQTREKRRAEPDVAVRAYAMAFALARRAVGGVSRGLAV